MAEDIRGLPICEESFVDETMASECDKMGRQEWYSISRAAGMVGVSESALRLWDMEGRFKPGRVLPSGRRLYSKAQLEHCVEEMEEAGKEGNYL